MNYSEISATEAFAFCVDRGWNTSAWSFWYAWRDATWEPRARILLGLPGATDADRKFILSSAALEEFYNARGWEQKQREDFYTRLWGPNW